MKKKIFLTLGLIVLVFGCVKKVLVDNNTGLPFGWQAMPLEKIKKYFPVAASETVTYVSENGVSRQYKCIDFDFKYFNDFGVCYSACSKCSPSEHFNIGSEFNSTTGDVLRYSISVVGNRTLLGIRYKNNDLLGNLEKEFENDKAKNMGMGWAKNPNEFIDYLTDTIEIPGRDNPQKIMGILVLGKGLVWFTDEDGVKWTLKE